MAQRSIAAGQFKIHCLQLMDQVQASKIPLVITKRGKPVARLVPVEEGPASLFGALQGTVVIKGDIVAPLDESWEVDG